MQVWTAWPIWQVFLAMFGLFIPLAFIRQRWYARILVNRSAAIVIGDPDAGEIHELFPFMRESDGRPLAGGDGKNYYMMSVGILVTPYRVGDSHILLLEDGTSRELNTEELGKVLSGK